MNKGHRLQLCSGHLKSSGLGELPDRTAKVSKISIKSYRLQNWGESELRKSLDAR